MRVWKRLFSLAASRLGATVTSLTSTRKARVHAELRRGFPGDDRWVVIEGSVLDGDLINSLGTFEVGYSWGVLHHTGAMWRAIDLTQRAVKPGGQYFIALYNDQGMRSVVWGALKRAYCSGFAGRALVSATCIPFMVLRRFASDVIRFQNPLTHYREYSPRIAECPSCAIG